MKRVFILLVILVCYTEVIISQTVVSGQVLETATDLAVPSANVIVKNANGKIMAYATTNNAGSFSLKLPTVSEGMTIHVTMMGFKNYSAPLNINEQPVKIRLEDGSFALKEVTVKAKNIRESGDTITYNVASFAQKNDRTIGDVLNRMPGIDVSSSGKIQYQGTDINKFYIEGSDLLGGKYGIATNGISYDDIGSVEVMENHQPMQVLQGISFSDQAAINLKLKGKAKSVWLANGHLTGGYSTQPEGGLWNGELFLMLAKARYQTITTLKSNNTGIDLRNQLRDFFSDNRGTELSSYLSLSLPSVPSFDSRRTLFNRSHMISSSHLWKLKNTEVKGQIDYYNHRASASASATTTYFLQNGDKVITEERSGVEHGNRLTGTFSLEKNQKRYYLNNTLKTVLDWNDRDVNMTGTMPNTQEATLPNYYVGNDLKLIKRLGTKHLITFTSVNEWEGMPQDLTVSSLSDGKQNKSFQHVGDYAFCTEENAKYGFLFHGFTISLNGGIKGYWRTMDSELNLHGDTENTINNSVTTNYLQLYVSPEINYSLKAFDLMLDYPMKLTDYHFNQSIANERKFLHAPSAAVRWKPNSLLTVMLRGGLDQSPVNLHDIHDGMLLSDYRTLHRGINAFYVNSSKRVSGTLRYRHAASGIFAHAIVMKSWGESPYQSAQEFTDSHIIYSYIPNTTSSQQFNAIGSLSKTLDFIRGGISLNGSYGRNKASMLSETVPTLYHNLRFMVGGRIYGNVADIWYISTGVKSSASALSVNHSASSWLHNVTYNFSTNLALTKSIVWEWEGEYYHNQITRDSYKDMMMLDTKLTWKIAKRLELQTSLNNILNKKIYSYKSYGTLTSQESTRYLRGRELMVSLYLTK